MIHSHCQHCGKPLNSFKSKRRGYGDECWKKVKQSFAGTNQLKVKQYFTHSLADPEKEIMIIREKEVRVNVPYTIFYHSHSGPEYGYGGSGPADLALNILDYFLKTDHKIKVGPMKCEVSARAFAIHQDFKMDFIQCLNSMQPVHKISTKTIRNWIEAALAALEDDNMNKLETLFS